MSVTRGNRACSDEKKSGYEGFSRQARDTFNRGKHNRVMTELSSSILVIQVVVALQGYTARNGCATRNELPPERTQREKNVTYCHSRQ
jgi:hypothetical protein